MSSGLTEREKNSKLLSRVYHQSINNEEIREWAILVRVRLYCLDRSWMFFCICEIEETCQQDNLWIGIKTKSIWLITHIEIIWTWFTSRVSTWTVVQVLDWFIVLGEILNRVWSDLVWNKVLNCSFWSCRDVFRNNFTSRHLLESSYYFQ